MRVEGLRDVFEKGIQALGEPVAFKVPQRLAILVVPTFGSSEEMAANSFDASTTCSRFSCLTCASGIPKPFTVLSALGLSADAADPLPAGI